MKYRHYLPIPSALFTLLVAGEAHAGGTWTFCMNWAISATDKGAGEDYHTNTTTMFARGVRVVVDHSDWEDPLETNASEVDGCFSFTTTSDANTGFRVKMFAETRIGVDGRLHLHAYPTNADRTAKLVPSWLILANPGGVPRKIVLQNTPDPVSNMIAWTTFGAYWIDHLSNPRAPAFELHAVPQKCPLDANNCTVVDDMNIHPDGVQKKFLIGHETGHWLKNAWASPFTFSNYDVSASEPECAWDGDGDHALRSREGNAAAFNEGFAHFLSTLMYNDHSQPNAGAKFRYYKDVDDVDAYSDLVADEYIVDVEGGVGNVDGGPNRWMETQCPTTAGHGVEMDWQRFYWDYRTDSGVRVPTHSELFQHVADAIENNPWEPETAWQHLRDSLFSSNLLLYARWNLKSAQNGTDH